MYFRIHFNSHTGNWIDGVFCSTLYYTARKWVKGDPQPISPGLPTSLYLQDQCSYLYDRVRTADHFFDGERQRIRASVKVAIDPRVTTLGKLILIFPYGQLE